MYYRKMKRWAEKYYCAQLFLKKYLRKNNVLYEYTCLQDEQNMEKVIEIFIWKKKEDKD